MTDRHIDILFESTDSLNSKIEKRIVENLLEKISKTLIIISHRLSSNSYANNILVVENGRLTQKGKHGSLVQENGLYKEMLEKQKKHEIRDKRNKS